MSAMPSTSAWCCICLENSGMDDHLSKPINAHLLTEKSRHWLAVGVESHAAKESKGKNSQGGNAVSVPIFDQEAVLARLDNDRELLQELISLFVEMLQQELDGLQSALVVGDADASRRHAHSIKGAAANIGAEAIRICASDLEKEARDGNIQVVRTGYASQQGHAAEFLRAIGWREEKLD